MWLIFLIIFLILLLLFLFWPKNSLPHPSFSKNTDFFTQYAQHKDIDLLRRQLNAMNKERSLDFNAKYGHGEELNNFYARNVQIITSAIKAKEAGLSDVAQKAEWTRNNKQLGLFLQKFKSVDLPTFEKDFDVRYQYLLAQALGQPFDRKIIEANQSKLNLYFN